MSKFQCPKCGSWDNRVWKTIPKRKRICRKRFTAVRRKRKCMKCNHRWVTIEMDETDIKAWLPQIGKKPVDLFSFPPSFTKDGGKENKSFREVTDLTQEKWT